MYGRNINILSIKECKYEMYNDEFMTDDFSLTNLGFAPTFDSRTMHYSCSCICEHLNHVLFQYVHSHVQLNLIRRTLLHS